MLRILLAIRQKSQEPRFWEVINSFVVLVYASLAALRNLSFRFRRFTLLVKTKKVISMNYGSSRSSWKPWRWMRLDLILTMKDIYIDSSLNLLKKFTSNSWSSKFKDTLSLKISQMITKTAPISTRIVIIFTMKRGIPFWVWQKVKGNWDNKIIQIPQWRESYIVKEIPATEKINKSKRAGLWE